MIRLLFTCVFLATSLFDPADASSPPNPALQRVDEFLPQVIIDMRYATKNNFTGKVIYKDPHAYLRPETIKALWPVLKELSKKGYTLVIFDAYRPPWAQQILFDAFPNPTFVAPPGGEGSRHSRGTTIDVTLADKDGNYVEMPTDFDSFSPKASHNLIGVSKAAAQHVIDLRNAFFTNGFSGVPDEWWHYDLRNWKDYPQLKAQKPE